jgi:MFS family permease
MLNRRYLYLITWLTDFSVFMIVFAVSRQLAEVKSDALFMGTLGAAFSMTGAVSSLLSGRASDRFGPLRIMGAGLWLVVLSAGSLVLSNGFVFAAYIAAGTGAGMVYPPLIGLLNRGRDSLLEVRAVGRTVVNFCLAWNLGIIAGQLGGGWLFQLAPNLPLIVSIGLAIVALIALAAFARSFVAAPPNIASSPEHLHHQSLSAAFARLAWTANLGGAFAMSTVVHLLPRLMVQMDIPAQRHGTMLALTRIFVIAMYIAMHRMRFWHHRFSTAAASQVLAAVGMALIAAAHSPWTIMLGLALMAQLMGYNYFASLYYSISGAAQDGHGAASGIHEATIGLGFAAGSFIGGAAAQWWGERAPYWIAACVIAGLMIVQVMMFVRYVQPRRPVASRSVS